MERNFLFIYNDNWCDEMNIDGIYIISEKMKDKFNKGLKNFKTGNFYIGTNEEIYYKNIKSVKEVYKIEELKENDYTTICDLGLINLGFAKSFFEFICSYYEESEDYLIDKIDNKEFLTTQEIKEMIFEFEQIDEYGGELERWVQPVSTIIQANGRFFKIDWFRGLTEMQENEYYDQPYEVFLTKKMIEVNQWNKKGE